MWAGQPGERVVRHRGAHHGVRQDIAALRETAVIGERLLNA